MSNTVQRAMKFWEDPDPDLYDNRPRSTIPSLPAVGDPIVTYTCEKGSEKIALAYLACVVRDTTDKLVIVKALASAVSILFGDNSNLTGSPVPTEKLTGLSYLTDDGVSESAVIESQFAPEISLKVSDVDPYVECDTDELGGYFGVLFMAGTKRVTAQNITAFNAKRLNSIRAATAAAPKIFVPASAFLDEPVLNRVYAAFNSLAAIRCQLIYNTALKMSEISYGPRVTFAAMFLLLVDQGMNSLQIIRSALRKHKEIVEKFPELEGELEAADKGMKVIQSADPVTRPYVKAIYGPSFVPAQQQSVANLLGVCRKIMTHYTPTLANFKGGYTTPAQDEKIARILRLDSSTAAQGVQI